MLRISQSDPPRTRPTARSLDGSASEGFSPMDGIAGGPSAVALRQHQSRRKSLTQSASTHCLLSTNNWRHLGPIRRRGDDSVAVVTDRHPSTDALAPTETYAHCVAVMGLGAQVSFTRVVVLMLALAATSCAGPNDSPSPRPGSATSSPRTLTPSQRAKLEVRQVIKIIASSSSDWKKTPVTCELQDGALRECLVSTLDLSRVVRVVGPPLSGAKYVL